MTDAAARVPFGEIVAGLRDDVGLVIDRYCSGAGAWTDHQGQHWCLSPLRPDRSVGSFCVHTRGPMQGRYYDHATGDKGDMLDLIRRVENVDQVSAIGIAKGLLGLVDLSAEERRQAEARARARAVRREADRREAEAEAAAKSRAAQALWLSASPDLIGTPVAGYLAARGIDLGALPRLPSVIRYHPGLRYREIDKETGEVIEGVWPAMVCAITGADGRHIATHRTWLACQGGRWGKAPVPKAKKVTGPSKDGLIRLWSGVDQAGAKGVPLARAPQGTRLYVTEGVEDALSVVVLRPEVRVVAAISLGNFAAPLPATVSEVVLVADNDPGPDARRAFDQAVSAHARAGRLVRVWRAPAPHKDLNDWVMAEAGIRPQSGGAHAA